ncbi:MAG: hypothetical protein M1820_008148 [Bogoriella megaspora]|nr:MAG: hypothetical protein M1820_008148 [Bogoriella megaspora]
MTCRQDGHALESNGSYIALIDTNGSFSCEEIEFFRHVAQTSSVTVNFDNASSRHRANQTENAPQGGSSSNQHSGVNARRGLTSMHNVDEDLRGIGAWAETDQMPPLSADTTSGQQTFYPVEINIALVFIMASYSDPNTSDLRGVSLE